MLFRMIPLLINFNWSFPTQKLNLVLLLTFFKRTQLKIGFVKIDEIEVCCTEFYALSNDTTLDQFKLEFSVLIDDFDWRFWLTILIDDFDWRFWLTILIDDFDWRFWLTILIDDFDWRFWLTILIDDFDWRFKLTILILCSFDWYHSWFWSMLYRILCFSNDTTLDQLTGVFTQKLNLVLLLTFFKRTQFRIVFVKMDEIEVCCTEFYALSNDTTFDQFWTGVFLPKNWT